VGKFDLQEAKKILEETFGAVDFKNNTVKETSLPPSENEPPQTQEKKFILSKQARPRVLVGYHKPTLPDPDDYVFDLIDQILGNGRSSRLYQSLVLKNQVASDVETDTGVPGSRLPNLFLIGALPLEGHDSTQVIHAIDEEIRKICEGGVTPEELEK